MSKSAKSVIFGWLSISFLLCHDLLQAYPSPNSASEYVDPTVQEENEQSVVGEEPTSRDVQQTLEHLARSGNMRHSAKLLAQTRGNQGEEEDQGVDWSKPEEYSSWDGGGKKALEQGRGKGGRWRAPWTEEDGQEPDQQGEGEEPPLPSPAEKEGSQQQYEGEKENGESDPPAGGKDTGEGESDHERGRDEENGNDGDGNEPEEGRKDEEGIAEEEDGQTSSTTTEPSMVAKVNGNEVEREEESEGGEEANGEYEGKTTTPMDEPTAGNGEEESKGEVGEGPAAEGERGEEGEGETSTAKQEETNTGGSPPTTATNAPPTIPTTITTTSSSTASPTRTQPTTTATTTVDGPPLPPVAPPRDDGTPVDVPSTSAEHLTTSTTSPAIIQPGPWPTLLPLPDNDYSPPDCRNDRGQWSEWRETGPCTAECGACGLVQRVRDCLSYREGRGCPCLGDYKVTEACNIGVCQYPQPSCCMPYNLIYVEGKFACGPQSDEIVKRFMEESVSNKTGTLQRPTLKERVNRTLFFRRKRR